MRIIRNVTLSGRLLRFHLISKVFFNHRKRTNVSIHITIIVYCCSPGNSCCICSVFILCRCLLFLLVMIGWLIVVVSSHLQRYRSRNSFGQGPRDSFLLQLPVASPRIAQELPPHPEEAARHDQLLRWDVAQFGTKLKCKVHRHFGNGTKAIQTRNFNTIYV